MGTSPLKPFTRKMLCVASVTDKSTNHCSVWVEVAMAICGMVMAMSMVKLVIITTKH
jgi:hypothetical protein